MVVSRFSTKRDILLGLVIQKRNTTRVGPKVLRLDVTVQLIVHEGDGTNTNDDS